MQKPFVRLGKYQPDQDDPQENRATETLAACLVFSEKLRREFLDFLFDNNPSFDTADVSAYEVSTQQPTDDGEWVDLLIEKESEVSIVVEVKVKADECGDQIRKYWDWLDRTKKGNANYVFSLVKNHNPKFDITEYKGKQHHTWRQLFDHLLQVGNHSQDCNDQDVSVECNRVLLWPA
jgi:hypothetical protein